MKWFVIFKSGYKEIIEAEDFYELHAKVSAEDVTAVVRYDFDE